LHRAEAKEAVSSLFNSLANPKAKKDVTVLHMTVVIPGHGPMKMWPDVPAVAQVKSMKSARNI
jgi:hypothetical protein